MEVGAAPHKMLAPRFARAMSTRPTLKSVLQKELDGIQAAGTFKKERVITSAQNARYFCPRAFPASVRQYLFLR